MVIAGFSIQDKSNRIRFLEKSFLIADTRIDVDFKMLFLAFSNANIKFNTESFTLRN